MQDTITIVIPTYGRDRELTDSVQALLALPDLADEILVLDQTPKHDTTTDRQLENWQTEGHIRWLKLTQPSITQAMNAGLLQSKSKLVLFLDDDIVPYPGLISAHRKCHRDHLNIWASVGQVIQPWQKPESVAAPRRLHGLRTDFDFPFHSTIGTTVANVMAGNLCVHRNRALEIGGFDQNFVGAAYRFETDFARRIESAQGTIRFCPQARIDHLRAERGGTRQQGSHLTSLDPRHGIGDHYYALRHGSGFVQWRYIVRRVFREVSTKYHLIHPWWIPIKLCGEVRAVLGAHQLARNGPQLLDNHSPLLETATVASNPTARVEIRDT